MTTSPISPLTGGKVGLWCDPAQVEGDRRVKDVQLPDGMTWTQIVQGTSERLYRMSGYRWMGAQTIVMRPERLTRDCECDLGIPSWGFGWDGGDGWWNRLFPESGLALALIDRIDLGGNVISVDEILVDGEVLDPATYGLYGNRTLVRFDDADGLRLFWPCCQRIAAPNTEVGTWQLTYQVGQMPPQSGRDAAYAWSLERGKRFDQHAEHFPAHTTRAESQGIALTIEEPAQLASGLIGIPEVDEFIESVNPARTMRRAQVYDPETIVPATVERRQ